MLIEFGNIDYKIIIPFIYPVLYQIKRLIHKDDDKKIFEIFMIFFGYLFSGVIYLIIKHRMKTLKEKKIQENLEIELKTDFINEPEEKEVNEIKLKMVPTIAFGENQLDLDKIKISKQNFKKQHLFILLLVLLYLIPLFLDSYTSSISFRIKTSSPVSLLICIISYIFLSRLFLGEKIYTHQIFSSIIIFISILIVIILYLINNFIKDTDENKENLFINLILILITSSLYAIFNIMEKKYYNFFLDSPYHLMFKVGLIGLILILFYEIITVLISGINKPFNGVFYQIGNNFEKYGIVYILIFIFDILSSFLFVCGIALTVYFFTPCHFIISESISQIIAFFTFEKLYLYSLGELIAISIFYFFILFSALIYNEIIIVNIYSLKYNTKKYINLRQIKETEEILLFDKNPDNEKDKDVLKVTDRSVQN